MRGQTRFNGRSLPAKPCANEYPSIDLDDGGGFNYDRGTRTAKRIGKPAGDRNTMERLFYVLHMRPVQGESSKQKEKSKCQIKMEQSTGKRSW
jgi:hypothetical protein